MIISIINNTDLHHQEVQDTLRAVNRQLLEDFKKYWHRHAELRLEGWTGEQPNPLDPLDMRGDAVIYLWDDEDINDALGYHDLNHSGVPYGFVFRRLSEKLGEPWSVTLSHEALELAMDPEVNLLAQGPHPDPAEKGRTVYHWYELCDAVQQDTYEIDGVKVSNFVLPLYFTISDEHKNHNDFLGLSLKSFGVREGGYVGFFDPKSGEHETWTAPNDRVASEHLKLKQRYGQAKRTPRRRGGSEDDPLSNVSMVACDVITFELETGKEEDLRETATHIVKDYLGKEWSLRPCQGDPYEFDAVYGGQVPISFGEAWENCYKLEELETIIFAEPSFPFPVPGETDAPDDDKRIRGHAIFGNDDHKPGTSDPAWAVKECRVPEAWAFIEAAGKRPGEGVLIGHPDSGFQEHPEMDITRVLTNMDYDFLDNDEETRTSKRSHGSHGLATASVIMSGRLGAIKGPALQSEIVPLRVTKPGAIRPTPVLTVSGMWRLRDAVDYATGIGCKVISMSLGGMPSNSLRKAIRRATNQGVIVLVAAGNVVRFVTPPASYDETIAVAGSNIDRDPWAQSCRGSKVDISAPGESVWRAAITKDGSNDTGRGSGTSYAVALTAGVAALWRSFHAAELEARNPKDIQELFRKVLKDSAQKDHNLPSGEFGAGIVDAEAILRMPIPRNLPGRTRRRSSTIAKLQLEEVIGTKLGVLSDSETREFLSAEILRAYFDKSDLSKKKTEDITATKGHPSNALSPRLKRALSHS